MDNKYCVYMHKNKMNGKVYIGKTINYKNRWRTKGIAYKPDKNRNQNVPFWNAICKYGWDNFEHIILVEGLTDEEANKIEKEYIIKYNSREKEYGYNVAEGGNGGRIYKEHPKGMKGKKHSEEKKEQQRDLMKKLNEEGKCGSNWENGHPKGFLGKHHNEETKKTMTLKAVESIKKKVKAILPNGEEKEFNSVTQAFKELKISNRIAYKLLNSGEPYKVSKNVTTNREYLKKLEGLILFYEDNTEVTYETKVS